MSILLGHIESLIDRDRLAKAASALRSLVDGTASPQYLSVQLCGQWHNVAVCGIYAGCWVKQRCEAGISRHKMANRIW